MIDDKQEKLIHKMILQQYQNVLENELKNLNNSNIKYKTVTTDYGVTYLISSGTLYNGFDEYYFDLYQNTVRDNTGDCTDRRKDWKIIKRITPLW